MTKTVTATIADYAAGTRHADLPPAVSERAKKIIFDEMACGYFGRRSAAGALAATYAVSAGGAPEARIYGTPHSAPAAFAALANGTAGHGEEVDGAHVIGGHPGASIVHAAVAMAEKQRSTGADLINAVTLGYDIGVRLVRACGGKFVVRDTRHLTSDFLYAFGCTVAAARLMGLGAERQAQALALASFQTNGLYALYSEKRHISKSFCNGQYAFAGISGAQMAAIGLEGNEDIIGSDKGLLTAWGVEGGAAMAVAGLGSEFTVNEANFKFFNAGYPIHTPVEATMTLVRQHAIAADQIAAIRIGMPENAMRVVDNRHMHNICVQDMVTASVVRGGLALMDLPFPSILAEPLFHDVRGRITVAVDPEQQRENPNGRGARVTITLKDGREVSLRVDNPKGHSRRGDVSWDDLSEKWTDSLPGCNVAGALAIARDLENLDDVAVLAQAFAGVMQMS